MRELIERLEALVLNEESERGEIMNSLASIRDSLKMIKGLLDRNHYFPRAGGEVSRNKIQLADADSLGIPKRAQDRLKDMGRALDLLSDSLMVLSRDEQRMISDGISMLLDPRTIELAKKGVPFRKIMSPKADYHLNDLISDLT